MQKTIVELTSTTNFGQMLYQAWKHSGLTQVQFAERLGVTQPRIPEIFAQESITEKLLDRCVEALEMTFEARIVQ